MSPSSRRWTGILIALALTAVTAGVSVWRGRVVDERGSAGVAFMPKERLKKAPGLPFGIHPGA